MAKLARGRIEGLHGMESQTADELHSWADRFERRARHGGGGDDPDWLRAWTERLRSLAARKEKARRHKTACRRDHDRQP